MAERSKQRGSQKGGHEHRVRQEPDTQTPPPDVQQAAKEAMKQKHPEKKK